jgi:hypothetical protein
MALLFNGAFNTLILGIPGWVWVGLILGLLAVFTNAYWYFLFWSPLRPLHGLWKANWNKIDASLLSDIDMNLKLVSEARAKVIFNESIDDAKKNEKDWKDITSGQIGVTGTDIILDLGKWTVHDTNERYMIEEAADNWNMEHPDDQVHSFYKFMRYCEEGKISIELPTLMVVPWIRIESSFPDFKKRNPALYAGYIRQLSEKMDKDEKAKFDSMALYILIGSVLVSALFVIGKFLMHKPA